MKSSWLLFKIFRRRLWLCLFVEVVVTFIVALNEDHLQQPPSVREVLGISAILAALLSLWGCLPTRFNALPFPVSVRQRAWLPLVGFALVWAGGGVAILAAILCHGVRLSWLPRFFFAALPLLPLYVLAFLFVFRILRAKPHFAGMLGMVGVVAQGDGPSWYQAVVGAYHLWWPLVLVAIACYLYEAPILLARRDRLLAGQAVNFRSFRMPDLMIASRRHAATWIADTVELGLVLALTIIFLFNFLPRLIIPGGWLGFGSIPLMLTLLFMPFLLVSIFRNQHKSAVASGFSPASALGLTLLQMTIVLYPLAQALGVKKGIVARCDQCQAAKFLWSSHCPHCGNPGPGTITNKRLAKVAKGDFSAGYRRIGFIARVFIPLQFFLMFGLFGNAGSRPFITYSTILTFRGGQDPQTQERALARVKELVTEHPDPADWIASAQTPGGIALQPPQRFRLEVKILDGGNVWISSHGLRWDSAEALPAAVARRLAGEIEEFQQVEQHQPHQIYSRGRGLLFQSRGYLDNQIHWIEPKPEKAPARKRPPPTPGPR